MPKPLVFLFGDKEYPLHLNKVDRSKLYGTKDLEVLDDHEEVCELATLADDGRTMIGKGGTGLCWLDADGKWCEKSELRPFNVDGDEVQPVKSSFNAPIKLFDTATAEDYLDHNVRLVYRMQFEGPSESEASASDLKELLDEIGKGTIFQFPYSYRGGLEADTAFLLQNEEGELMMLVGNKTDAAYVGIQQQVLAPDPEEEEDAEDALMDFDMI